MRQDQESSYAQSLGATDSGFLREADSMIIYAFYESCRTKGWNERNIANFSARQYYDIIGQEMPEKFQKIAYRKAGKKFGRRSVGNSPLHPDSTSKARDWYEQYVKKKVLFEKSKAGGSEKKKNPHIDTSAILNLGKRTRE